MKRGLAGILGLGLGQFTRQKWRVWIETEVCTWQAKKTPFTRQKWRVWIETSGSLGADASLGAFTRQTWRVWIETITGGGSITAHPIHPSEMAGVD